MYLEAPRQQHYYFAHQFLAEKVSRSPALTVQELSEESGLGYLKTLWVTVGLGAKGPGDEFISADGLGLFPFSIGNESRGVIVEFPEPRGPAEAFFVAILVPADAKPGEKSRYHYITLELSPSRPSRTIMGGWTVGMHANYGAGPEPDLFAFKAAVEAHIKGNTGLVPYS